LLVTNVDATVVTPSFGVGRSFGLFGRTAQAFAVLPFSSADASGNVGGAEATTSRAGLSDMRLRLSWLVRGAPAGSAVDVAKAPAPDDPRREPQRGGADRRVLSGKVDQPRHEPVGLQA
jgi:hypothetical protein